MSHRSLRCVVHWFTLIALVVGSFAVTPRTTASEPSAIRDGSATALPPAGPLTGVSAMSVPPANFDPRGGDTPPPPPPPLPAPPSVVSSGTDPSVASLRVLALPGLVHSYGTTVNERIWQYDALADNWTTITPPTSLWDGWRTYHQLVADPTDAQRWLLLITEDGNRGGYG